MYRRMFVKLLTSLGVLLGIRSSKAAEGPSCSDCGTKDAEFYQSVGWPEHPESLCPPCARKRADAEFESRRCRGCGCGTKEYLGCWVLTDSYCCMPCYQKEVAAVFEAASCKTCEGKPVVVFEDGTPLCAEHRRKDRVLINFPLKGFDRC